MEKVLGRLTKGGQIWVFELLWVPSLLTRCLLILLPPSVLDTKWRQDPNRHFFYQWKFPFQKVHFYTAVRIVFFLLFLKRILCPISVFGGGAFWPPTAIFWKIFCTVVPPPLAVELHRYNGLEVFGKPGVLGNSPPHFYIDGLWRWDCGLPWVAFKEERVWRDGSVVKSSACSSRGLVFNF